MGCSTQLLLGEIKVTAKICFFLEALGIIGFLAFSSLEKLLHSLAQKPLSSSPKAAIVGGDLLT